MEAASLNIGQTVRTFAHRYGVAAFWRWWVGQLNALVPAGTRNAIRRRRLYPIIAFEPGAAVLSVPHVEDNTLAFVESARIPVTDDAGAAALAGRAAIDALPRNSYSN